MNRIVEKLLILSLDRQKHKRRDSLLLTFDVALHNNA